eukprot:gene46946-58566_t
MSLLATQDLTIRFGGHLRASEGQVLLDGQDLSSRSAPQRTKAGLGRAFQLTQLFPHLTVLENVRLAVQARRGMGLKMFSVWLSHRALIDEAMAIVERVRLGSRAQALAASLPHGDQRKLEIMRTNLGVGSRLPAPWTSMGRVLLAGLSDDALQARLSTLELQPFTAHTAADLPTLLGRIRQARTQGWCLVNQELEEGLISIAAPLTNR